MLRSYWSDRPQRVSEAALSATRIAENIDEVARMATSLHSSVARFRH